MNIAIFGLSISSSWGNGHATIWRGLVRALISNNHKVTFFERNVPYYAQNRDFLGMDGLNLVLYNSWHEIELTAASILNFTDVAIVTSYCPDALVASDLILCREVPLNIFYDLDAAVTLEQIENGKTPFYIGKKLLKDYDLVFSYSGGQVLDRIKERLAAKEVFPLYGCVDPLTHRPVKASPVYSCDMSYLGTFAKDRQEMLQRLLIETAKKNPVKNFIIGGAQYPENFPWAENVFFVAHVPPSEHSSFYCSCKFTLNVTRSAMAETGFSPSGRLFEAASCGVPVISDRWKGVEQFFTPGEEIIIASDSDDVMDALQMSEERRMTIAIKAYQRVQREHTAMHRVKEFERILGEF
jgi:spore maturation protein CgeB